MAPETLASLIEAMPLPGILIGQNECILESNAAAVRLLGLDLRGRHFITALRQPDVLDTIEACLRDGETRTARYLGNDGAQDTSFVVNCATVTLEQGRAVLVTFEDVTHLRQASQIRRDFVANVSHELRTPLTALMGFIETLKGPAKGDAKATARFLDIMQAEGMRMDRLVRDLLELSRVEAKQRVRPTTPVDLGQTVQSVLHTLRPMAAENEVEITLNAPAGTIEVLADSDQLAQVVSNLIENAVKYGGAGKPVEVTLSQRENEPLVRGPAVEIRVEDHGPGIDPVHLPRLTERFYRVDSHRSREMGGTGLGLAIVKHIINRHRGRLRVTSTPGQGSAFRVILPGGRAPD